jgi:hypothetical protein
MFSVTKVIQVKIQVKDENIKWKTVKSTKLSPNILQYQISLAFDQVEIQGLNTQCLLHEYSVEQSLTNSMQ